MRLLALIIAAAWLVFFAVWLGLGIRTGFGRPNPHGMRLRVVTLFAAAIYLAILQHAHIRWAVVHVVALQLIGVLLIATGWGLAVWARTVLGRNWGMPGSTHDSPTLVTRGPYRVVRHPIYSGLMLAYLGSALALNLLGIVVLFALGATFVVSARQEERTLTDAFPADYPAYARRTRMLVPFVL